MSKIFVWSRVTSISPSELIATINLYEGAKYPASSHCLVVHYRLRSSVSEYFIQQHRCRHHLFGATNRLGKAGEDRGNQLQGEGRGEKYERPF